jgi:hypothetical protein
MESVEDDVCVCVCVCGLTGNLLQLYRIHRYSLNDIRSSVVEQHGFLVAIAVGLWAEHR